MRSISRPSDVGWLAGFLGISFGAAALGGVTTARSVGTWYKTIRKPTWNPPNWLFGPVWTVLYAMMAVSAWLVQREARNNPAAAREGNLAVAAWVHQLTLNVTWSWVFFGQRRIGHALGVIFALWLAIVETIWLSWRVSKKAALLLAPYLAWTTFAGVLNFRVWQLNRKR
jgi:translocator protein